MRCVIHRVPGSNVPDHDRRREHLDDGVGAEADQCERTRHHAEADREHRLAQVPGDGGVLRSEKRPPLQAQAFVAVNGRPNGHASTRQVHESGTGRRRHPVRGVGVPSDDGSDVPIRWRDRCSRSRSWAGRARARGHLGHRRDPPARHGAGSERGPPADGCLRAHRGTPRHGRPRDRGRRSPAVRWRV